MLDWTALTYVGLDCTYLCWTGLHLPMLDWTALTYVGLDCTYLCFVQLACFWRNCNKCGNFIDQFNVLFLRAQSKNIRLSLKWWGIFATLHVRYTKCFTYMFLLWHFQAIYLKYGNKFKMSASPNTMSILVRKLGESTFSLIRRKFFANSWDYFGRQLKFFKMCVEIREKC
jgi:hypothetical protein